MKKVAILALLALSQNAWALEVDVSDANFNSVQSLGEVRKHFVSSNVVDLLIKGIDQKPIEGASFLQGIVNLVQNIGPRANITLETTNISVSKMFSDSIGALPNGYGRDINVLRRDSSTARCVSLLAGSKSRNEVFVNSFLKRGYDFALFEKRSLLLGDKMKENAERVWEFLEAPNRPAGASEEVFTILSLEGDSRNGKSYLLHQLHKYLGWNIEDLSTSKKVSVNYGPSAYSPSPFTLIPQDEVVTLYLSQNDFPQTNFYFSNPPSPPRYMDLLRWALDGHDGTQPLVVMIDSFEHASLKYQMEVMGRIHEHILRLGESRDSLKVIIAARPGWNGSGPGGSYNSLMPGSEFLKHWNDSTKDPLSRALAVSAAQPSSRSPYTLDVWIEFVPIVVDMTGSGYP